MSRPTPLRWNWAAWLLADVPSSRRHALLAQRYRQWLVFRNVPTAMLGLVIILALLLAAVFAAHVAPYDPIEQALDQRLLAPSPAHWFGTDPFGRDILSRVIFGTRITLLIVVVVVLTVGPVGLLIGCTAGYYGGWVSGVLMRVTDVFLAFPRLVLALAFVGALGPGLENAILAIALTAWPPYARVARAETLVVRRSDYVAAARLQGAPPWRVIWKHVVPMCMPSVIVRSTLDMASVILTAAGLGFLGLGAQPPLPEWGAMISAGREQIFDQWWVVTFPGLAIVLVALAFNLVGDGLRDVMDAR